MNKRSPYIVCFKVEQIVNEVFAAEGGFSLAGLLAKMEERRKKMISWLNEQDIKGQFEVEEPQAGVILRIKCTSTVSERLRLFPGVERVLKGYEDWTSPSLGKHKGWIVSGVETLKPSGDSVFILERSETGIVKASKTGTGEQRRVLVFGADAKRYGVGDTI